MASHARYENGELDEVVADNVSLHLERLDSGVWWLGITHPDGTEDHVTLMTKRRGTVINGTFEADS